MSTFVEGASEVLKLAAGAELNEQLPWTAQSVKVDNPGPQWLHLVGTEEFIPPGCVGTIRNLPAADFARAEWLAPWGANNPSVVGQVARLTYYSDWLEPVAGTISVDNWAALQGLFDTPPAVVMDRSFTSNGAGGFNFLSVDCNCSLIPGWAQSLMIVVSCLVNNPLQSLQVRARLTAAGALLDLTPQILSLQDGFVLVIPLAAGLAIQNPPEVVVTISYNSTAPVQTWRIAAIARAAPAQFVPGLPSMVGPQKMAGSTSVTFASDQLGQQQMAFSVPVTLASNQPAVTTDPSDRPARQLGLAALADSTFALIASIATAAADALAAATNALAVRALGYLFNGTTWDRARAGAQAVLAALSSKGAALIVPAGTWSIQHAPNVSLQATITRAAGAAGVSHVCTAVSFGFSASTAPVATKIIINLRDGAAGAGAILKSWTFNLPAAAIGPFSVDLSGLNIVGSAATAMTLEFSALLTNLLEYVNLEGYDAAP